jgi:hypothetical protein
VAKNNLRGAGCQPARNTWFFPASWQVGNLSHVRDPHRKQNLHDHQRRKLIKKENHDKARNRNLPKKRGNNYFEKILFSPRKRHHEFREPKKKAKSPQVNPGNK